MDTAVVQQFLNVFQDYIDLCHSENWPHNDTSEQEIRNAFLMCQHVVKSLNKLQSKGIIDEFLSTLYSHQDKSHSSIKYCLVDPPKCLLNKIMNSDTKISQVDVAFRLFLELFSEDILAQCLSDIMLEVASKETLLSNLENELEKDTLLKFKSEILLSQLSGSANIQDIISNCNLAMVELLLFCLSNTELKHSNSVKLIKQTVLYTLSTKDCAYKHFWKLLFEVSDEYFIALCLNNLDVFKLIVQGLLDCGKLLREGMSVDSFYIALTRSELVNIVIRLSNNDCLKVEFFSIVDKYDTDVKFWQNMLKF